MINAPNIEGSDPCGEIEKIRNRSGAKAEATFNISNPRNSWQPKPYAELRSNGKLYIPCTETYHKIGRKHHCDINATLRNLLINILADRDDTWHQLANLDYLRMA